MFQEILSEIERVFWNAPPITKAILIGLLTAFIFACFRSFRKGLDKSKIRQSKTPAAKSTISICAEMTGHYFPPVKNGRTSKCRYCPATLTRPPKGVN